MAARSWQGVIIGAGIALILPISYWLLALILESGIVTFTRTGFHNDLIMSLGLNAFAAVVLALIGIGTAGRAARLQSPLAWLGLVVIALPVLALVWFVSYATLGGAMGSPF